MNFTRILALGLALSTFAAAKAAESCAPAKADRLQITASYVHKDLPTAIRQLQEALKSCPSESFFHFMLGNALYRAGRLRDSAAAYESFVKEYPTHVEAQICLGFVNFELRDQNKAIEHWTVAERAEPESPLAHAALAAGFYAIGDESNALLQYQKAQAIDSRYADTDGLAVDIRWKPEIRAVLAEVKRTIQTQGVQ